MSNILSRLHIGKKSGKAGRLPSKRSMNLYVKVKDGNSWQVLLPLAIFLVLVVACIYRLGVVNRLNRLNELRHENAVLSSELKSLDDQLKAYPELQEEYRRFTTGYLAPDEQGLVKRSRIFEMLKASADGIGTIKSLSIEGNQVGMIVDIASLESIELIQDRLNEMDNIDEIKVSTARGTNNVEVEGYIIFTVKEETAEETAGAGSVSRTSSQTLSETERNEKYQSFTQAAADARTAAAASASGSTSESAASGTAGAAAASSGAASAGSTAAGSSAAAAQSGSSGTAGAAASGSSAGQGAAAASVSSAASGSSQAQAAAGASGTASAAQQQTQNINGDEVVVVPEGLLPYSFDSLEAGQQALSASGG